MRLTPLDIRGQQFRRVMRGLDAEEVETFLAAVASECEALVGENKELRQRVVELEEKVTEYRNMEKALRDTLLTAERVMGDAKDSAQREATLIIREAELSAQRVTARLGQEMTDMRRELAELRRLKDAYMTRVRWLLRSHLELIEGHAQEFGEIDAGLRLPAAPPLPGHERHERVEPEAPPAVARPAAHPQFDGGAIAAGGGLAASRAAVEGDPGVPPLRPTETWRGLESAPEGGLPPGDDLTDVLRPVAPDGSYKGVPGAPRPERPRQPSVQELAEEVRRAERLAAEARAAAERRPAPAPPAGDGAWSMERFRQDLAGEEPLP